MGEGEGDTVAGRMSGAVLVTPARPGHQVVPGGRQGPLQTRGRRLTAQSSRPWPPTPSTPSPWTGATSSPPGPALQEPLGAPVHFCQARCPWQRGTGENTNGLLREVLPHQDPTGRHQPHADPTGAQSTQPTTTQTPRQENPRGSPHTARCTSCEKPSLNSATAAVSCLHSPAPTQHKGGAV